MGYIYKIRNLVNNKYYIGQTTQELEERWRQHKQKNSNCRYLKRAFNKYVKNIKNHYSIDIKCNMTTPLYCNHCNFKTSKYGFLYNHIINKHYGNQLLIDSVLKSIKIA